MILITHKIIQFIHYNKNNHNHNKVYIAQNKIILKFKIVIEASNHNRFQMIIRIIFFNPKILIMITEI